MRLSKDRAYKRPSRSSDRFVCLAIIVSICFCCFRRALVPTFFSSRLLSRQSLAHRAGPEGVLLVTGPQEPVFSGRTQVVFDVMDTVVRDPFSQVAPKFFGMSQDEFWEAKNSSAWFAFERGEIDEGELKSTYFKDGRNFDIEGFKRALFEGFEIIDGMPELLHDLQDVGHKLHAFSNYPEWYTLIEEKLGLQSKLGLQWTCVSCDTGLRKPERAAYLHLLRRLGVARKLGAAPVLFIDNSAENCDSAEGAGIQAIQFKDAKKLRDAMGRILGSRKDGTVPKEGWPPRAMR